MYYIGIDGGGTQGRLIGVDINGNIIGESTCGSTNIFSNSHDVVKDNLKNLINTFNLKSKTNLSDCIGLCIGSAGVDTSSSILKMENILRELDVNCKLKIVNDSELILAAETKGEEGICIISGTGSIGFAIDKNGKCMRSGGWGYIIDDGGSGYYIGMEAIKEAFSYYDGRKEYTILYDKIKKFFNVDNIEDILNYIYSNEFNKSKIAEIAMIVKKASLNEDITSKKIEKEAAFKLFELVKALSIKANINKAKVVISGSILLLNENILKSFTKLVNDFNINLEIIKISEKPQMGAIYLAMKL